MIRADFLVTGLKEVATLSDGAIPRVGAAMTQLSSVPDATIAVDRGHFAYVGPGRTASREVRLRSGGRRLHAEGCVALPGLVDAHTHLLFAGDRSDEVGLKVRGATYSDIARRGGGLYSTVRSTRAASDVTVLSESADRLRSLARSGVTYAEVKSGYALEHEGEIRLLRLIRSLARRERFPLVSTYLGAHAVPPEFSRNPDTYVSEIVNRTLPAIQQGKWARFCDVFCEPGFFDVDQARRILRAAGALGLGLKIHADEFVASGGAQLAAELGSASADHLLATPTEDRERLARAGVTAVLLPLTPTASMSPLRSPGREMVDANVPVALGSDMSPNSWVEAMPLVLTKAVYGGRLTPQESITAATVNAAHAIGVSDRAGMIRPGRPADFVLFDAPSVTHVVYRFGAFPRSVYRQGIRVPSREMRP